MRGEQPVILILFLWMLGSPPHARGAGLCVERMLDRSGITPACAGSRDLSAANNQAQRDHPRMRGEQLLRYEENGGDTGSPPHARGAARCCVGLQLHAGITPACAGSRLRTTPAPTPDWDHPRMRGEQTKKVQSYKGFFVFFYQISFNF